MIKKIRKVTGFSITRQLFGKQQMRKAGCICKLKDNAPRLHPRIKQTESMSIIQGVTGGTDQTSGGCSLC